MLQMYMNELFAHVKWFQEPVPAIEPALSAIEWLAVIGFTMAALTIARKLQQQVVPYEKRIDRKLAGYAKYVPTVVRAATALGLLTTALQGGFLAPNLSDVPDVLLVLEAAVGIFWIAGVWTRYVSGLFLFIFLVAMFSVSVSELGEQLEYVGVAIYLGIMGGGAWALDEFRGKYQLPLRHKRGQALRAFLAATGAALIWLALSEKLLDISLAQAFLETHNWNILSGLGLSDRLFVIAIGSIELVFGLMLFLNILPRLAVALIAGAMATTAMLLGATEVPGHLFAIGLAAAIWVNDTD